MGPADAPETSATPVATPGQAASYEDLGGPTPENSKPDDNSNALKTPGATLKQVKDVVNKGAALLMQQVVLQLQFLPQVKAVKWKRLKLKAKSSLKKRLLEEAVVSEEETTETTDETEVVS